MKDKTKLLHERALITCVIMLFLCIILKLFGFQWFNLDTDIPILKEIDKFITSNYYLLLIYSVIFTSINNFLILGCSTKQEMKQMIKWSIKFIPLNIILIVMKDYCSDSIKLFLDIFFLLLMNFIMKGKIKRIIFFMFVNILYQLISLFIRSLVPQCGYYSIIYSLLLNIDYYIMFLITYIVVLKGGISCFRVTFSSLANQLWKRHTEDSQQSSESKER